MKFCSLASGSSGNCEYLEYNNTKILIDAGLSGKKIEGLLKEIEVNPHELDAIFVTHEHIDHIKGLGVMAKRYNLKIFATDETIHGAEKKIKNIPMENVYIFKNGLPFRFKDLDVLPMQTFHDCILGSSFVFTNGKKKVSILTDTGYVNPEMLGVMEGSDLFFLEANHDEKMLLEGPYPWALKQRILSNRGHLSNEFSKDVLLKLLKREKEQVVLAHLSKDNNTPKLAEDFVVQGLMEKDFVEGRDFYIEVAPRDNPSQMFKVK